MKNTLANLYSKCFIMPQLFPSIMPGAESFFYRGGVVGCLCLHGFMASPAEVRWLGAHLAEAGLTVYGVRLPGHGTHERDMARQSWMDWYTASLDGLKVLQAQCDRVFVVGHSMGGMLALLLAATAPLHGVAALAAPVVFRSRMMAQSGWLKYVRPYTDQTDHSPLQDTIRSEQTRRGEPVLGRVRYDIWSTAAVGEIFALAEVLQVHLPQITAPLLLVYSANDKTVSLENRDIIQAKVKSRVVECQTLQNSEHILPQDTERESVFAWVSDFILRNDLNTSR
jgi:carboxylesterase